jgi:predicted metalloprotease with PDZ domain
MGSSSYNAGLEKGDKIIKIGDFTLSDDLDISVVLKNFKPGDETIVVYERYRETKETILTFVHNPSFSISLFESHGLELDDKKKKAREDWLSSKN